MSFETNKNTKLLILKSQSHWEEEVITRDENDRPLVVNDRWIQDEPLLLLEIENYNGPSFEIAMDLKIDTYTYKVSKKSIIFEENKPILKVYV